MLPENLQITVFPTKSLIKYHESIIHQIETMERKTFPKNEIMAIKEEIAKKTNTLLITYNLSTENEKQNFENNKSNKRNKESSERKKNDVSKKVIKIFGYLIYSHISLSTSPVTRILKLCIHPSSRRNGLGSMLLEYTIKKTGVPQKSRADLYVDTERLNAINLYHKVGFKIKDQVKDYYEIGRDAWLMELS